MARKPYKLYDNRGNELTLTGSGNHRFRSAFQGNQRKRIHALDRDYQRTVTGYGRRTMMTIGRWLYANYPQVRLMVNDILDATTSQFEPYFMSEDPIWNEEAETALANHDKIADVRGRPFTNNVMRRMQLKAALIDGDGFILLTRARNSEFPLFQFIPGHRVYSEFDGELSNGRMICDGVIYNEVGRATAYRVWGESEDSFTDISANDLIPCFKPDYPDQFRGHSILACSMFDLQDVQETREFELQAQKIAATIGLIEYNERGEADEEFIDSESDDENGQGLFYETREGGAIQYFKAGSGARLESLRHDRPTQNQMNFEERVSRDTFGAAGWSYYFSVDPTKIGGVSMRVTLDKINNSKKVIQDTVLRPVEFSKDIYRTAKLIEVGQLSNNSGWARIGYVGGPNITADKKYDAQVAEIRLKYNLSSLKDEATKLGTTPREIMDQRIKEELMWRAKLESAGLPYVPLFPDLTTETDRDEFITDQRQIENDNE